MLPLALLMLLPPIPQDPAYHAFADQRTLFGIPNFWNVVSNLPFIVIGAIGLIHHRDNPATIVLFAGIFRVLASFQVAVPAAQGTEATPQPANTAA